VSISSSVVLWDQRQLDGRRYVRERHTDHLGVPHDVDYLAEAVQDVSAGLSASAARVVDGLEQDEIGRDLVAIYQDGDAAGVTTAHATIGNIRVALREAYRMAARNQALALGAFLNTLTNAQLAALFGLANPSVELTALRTRLTNRAAQWATFVAATGE